MTKGFHSKAIPELVLGGINNAFNGWIGMSGEWLKTAPEYLLTVNVAQHLIDGIPWQQRTVWMERNVADTLNAAGGIQRGPNSKRLRADGRFDIVLGHGDRRPRTVIELKSPLWSRTNANSDLHRICRTLLQGKEMTQLYSGIFAFYTSSSEPKRKDGTAGDRLERKWIKEWKKKTLKTWTWAGKARERYKRHLTIDMKFNINEVDSDHAWAAGCVIVKRKTSRQLSNCSPHTVCRET